MLKTLESSLDSKEIQPVYPKGDQSWVFIARTDAEAETPIFWPPDTKSWLIGKDPDVGRDWGAGGEGDNRGWGGWMASPTRCTWVWVNSGSWWCTGRPGVLWFMGSQNRTWLSDWTDWTDWTDHNLDYKDLCQKVMSLLFNTLSRFVIASHLLFRALGTHQPLSVSPGQWKNDQSSGISVVACKAGRPHCTPSQWAGGHWETAEVSPLSSSKNGIV